MVVGPVGSGKVFYHNCTMYLIKTNLSAFFHFRQPADEIRATLIYYR